MSVAVVALAGVAGCAAVEGGAGVGGGAPDAVARLATARTWAIQLQGYERPGAWSRLAGVPVDMLVVDPVRSVRGRGREDMAVRVTRMRAERFTTGEPRLCLAYLNVGQAEDYRSYWGADWVAPAAEVSGQPDFLISVDPEGWAGNYPVAYWDSRWRSTLFGHPDAPLDQILADGFDGVFLDWVLGFACAPVVEAAREQGVDPARAMVDLLIELRAYARARRPDFVLVALNGVELVDRDPRLLPTIDALVQEDLTFRGDATAKWDEPGAGGQSGGGAAMQWRQRVSDRLSELSDGGVKVFTLDYAVAADDVDVAVRRSHALGGVPCVSQTPLDRLPRHVWGAGRAAVPAR